MEDFVRMRLRDSDGNEHSAIKVLRPGVAHDPRDIYNIVMVDVSTSMALYKAEIVSGWMTSVRRKLEGRINMYAFGDTVRMENGDATLDEKLFAGEKTKDLTSALRTIKVRLDDCQESNVRIFLITDGEHSLTEPYPEREIKLMNPPKGKAVSVYVVCVGIGNSNRGRLREVRLKLHNGDATSPDLFLAENVGDITKKLAELGEVLTSPAVRMKLNVEGYSLPGLDKTSTIHFGEWLYFPGPLEELPTLSYSTNDDEFVTIETGTVLENDFLSLKELFQQWNTRLKQQRRKKKNLCQIDHILIGSIYYKYTKMVKTEVAEEKKNIKRLQFEFKEIRKDIEGLVNCKGITQEQKNWAKKNFLTSVTERELDVKCQKQRKHSEEDYEKDMVYFQKCYEAAKPQIAMLPPPNEEDRCRYLLNSTLSDLQEPDFPDSFKMEKSKFLKNFTMTGIPVFIPITETSKVNPWVIAIKNVSVNPYDILGQNALESVAEHNYLGDEHKEVSIDKRKPENKVNAIIPIVPASAADVLKPLVLSNIYAMMATFCILKNPCIIDRDVHLAALGCVWMATVNEFPAENRPEYVRNRLDNIKATASIYLDRDSVIRYTDALIKHPKQALMTRCNSLKCESLIQPTFIMYLKKDMFSQQQINYLFKHLISEFVGRCLSGFKRYRESKTPFSDLFCKELTETERNEGGLTEHYKAVADSIAKGVQGNLLQKFFTKEDLKRHVKKNYAVYLTAVADRIEDADIDVDQKAVYCFKKVASCGDITLSSFESWAQEMGIPEETIQHVFGKTQIGVYVCHALQHRKSKTRLSAELPKHEDAMVTIKMAVAKENKAQLLSEVEKLWHDEYMKIHNIIVMPLTQEQVTKSARTKGIEVSPETFYKVYSRYNKKLGLLRNACQNSSCPHYLQPHSDYNQHLSVERTQEGFPHSLHLTSYQYRSQGVQDVIEEIVSNQNGSWASGEDSNRKKKKKEIDNNQRASSPSSVKKYLSEYTQQMELLIGYYSSVSDKN